jgi:hypothetical protein
VILYSQPPDGTGSLIASSWVYPDGSDADMYAYDNFMLTDNADVTEVHWRGGYAYGAMYGRVQDFSVYFYESIAAGTEPHISRPDGEETIYLARYFVGGIASETFAGNYGGVSMYDYSYTFPTPVHLTAGVKYWIRIEGYQLVYPDWSMSKATGGNGQYFRYSTGLHMFQFVPGDTAFTLLGDVTSTTVWPTTTVLGPGAIISGVPGDMFSSNNVSFILRPGPVLVTTQDPVKLVLSGNAPGGSPSDLVFLVKSSASTFSIRQRIEVYNFATTSYEEVSFAPPTYNPQVITIASPANHVGPNNEVRARLSYRLAGAVIVYPWTVSIDEATWRYTP